MNKKGQSISLQSIAILGLVFFSFIILSLFFLLSFSESAQEIDKSKTLFFPQEDSEEVDTREDIVNLFPSLNRREEGKFYYNSNKDALFFLSEEEELEVDFSIFESKEEIIRIALLGNFLFSYPNYERALEKLSELEKRQKEYELVRTIDVLDKNSMRVSYEVQWKGEDSSHLNLYFFYPKQSLKETSYIQKREEEGAFFFLAQKDPVIGMRIQTNNSKLSYEVPYTQEYKEELLLVLEEDFFQGPDFLATYREETCKRDEAFLFSFENFNASFIYENESAKYNLCLSHREYYLSSKKTNYSELLFYIEEDNTFSVENSSFAKGVYLEVLNKSAVELSFKVQKSRPNETYSCIASVSNKEAGLFGNCEVYENRLWLALEEKNKESFQKETSLNRVWFLAFASFFVLLFIFILYERKKG